MHTLDSLADGERSRVAAVADGPHAARLLALGFDEGVAVEVIHRAPFGGDPIAVRVGAATVALSRGLALQIVLDAA